MTNPTPNSEACLMCNGKGKLKSSGNGRKNDWYTVECPSCHGTGKKPSVCPNSNCHAGHIYNDELSGGLPCQNPFHTSQAPDPDPDDVTLCPGCGCATHTTIAGRCGKCGANKSGQAPMPGKQYIGELLGVPVISDPAADKPYMRDKLASDPMPGSEPEHICTGGSWNNSTRQFECRHIMEASGDLDD